MWPRKTSQHVERQKESAVLRGFEGCHRHFLHNIITFSRMIDREICFYWKINDLTTHGLKNATNVRVHLRIYRRPLTSVKLIEQRYVRKWREILVLVSPIDASMFEKFANTIGRWLAGPTAPLRRSRDFATRKRVRPSSVPQQTRRAYRTPRFLSLFKWFVIYYITRCCSVTLAGGIFGRRRTTGNKFLLSI